MKKYNLSYTSGATGYGWQQEFDTINEFEDFINEKREDISAKITVWDNEKNIFIYWKDCLIFKPRIDMLHDVFRDMRTETRNVIIESNFTTI